MHDSESGLGLDNESYIYLFQKAGALFLSVVWHIVLFFNLVSDFHKALCFVLLQFRDNLCFTVKFHKLSRGFFVVRAHKQ